MFTPSKKLFYCVEAVLYIAYNAKTGPIAGNEIAAAQNLPTRYLEPMMQKLVRAGILRGVRGPAGGYMLGRERRRITLADICAVFTDDEMPEMKTALGDQVLKRATANLMEQWKTQLANIDMAQLCEQASTANIEASTSNPNDFII